ncbi:CPBP family intramembrane metalloprotease [Arthrobacter sp. zg-Y20]|uniref:CPBP family intramembrane glutamic endopeptidase n=1 Tax=unclassified Arthrobacter TaxID=235627 RepID=UPI001D159DCF|nr:MULTISPECIES: CPBP family intramembrane glutamic endopeptidase [unclassified Arthrobacter]MCC3276210.1 CPBP family intramembrane metalloprotease [Arthrobacter sp. zg-Y20]MDK1316370.1 CPBP family intramembrane metalloprotease [Arthrobacter sp. zg.Y20]WIB06417.1 CPBP family intramembrane metalloprotease [Arthrobacter sp. zg-Y20]
MKFVLQLLAVTAVAVLGNLALQAVDGSPWPALAVGVAVAVLAVLAYRRIVRVTERRSVAELAWPGAARAAGRGTVAGVVLFAAAIGIIAAFGGYQITGLGSAAGAVGLIGLMCAAAVTEELIFRGVLFRWVEVATGTWCALVLTGSLFGLVHLLNPHASLWGAVAIAVEAGGMLTAAYIATRSLWLPIGLHFGWNAAASALFSTEVSGNNTPQGLLDAATSGPTLLTGGDFGPEGSIFAVLFCGLATLAFLHLAARRGNIVSFRAARGTARAKVAQ